VLFRSIGQVLVGRRKGSHGEGMLSVPGGHLEFFEKTSEACDRELLEEIGVNFSGQYESFGFSEDFFDGSTRKHYITLYFVVNGVDSDNTQIQNMEPHKCEGWEWVDVDELPDNMFCDTYNKITQYAKVNYPIVNLNKKINK
jgi:8-oxo-dGTP diphosphatase